MAREDKLTYVLGALLAAFIAVGVPIMVHNHHEQQKRETHCLAVAFSGEYDPEC